jgi:hypothetical protein
MTERLRNPKSVVSVHRATHRLRRNDAAGSGKNLLLGCSPTSLSALSSARLPGSGPSASSPRPAAPSPRGRTGGWGEPPPSAPARAPEGSAVEREGARIFLPRTGPSARAVGRASATTRVGTATPAVEARRSWARRRRRGRGVLRLTRWARAGAKQPLWAKRGCWCFSR